MEFGVRKEGKIAIIRIRGKLNREGAIEMTSRVRQTCGSDRWAVLNLSGVIELVSVGISCLTEIRDWTRREGGRLVLAESSPAVKEVLKITGLDALFLLMDTEAEAVKFLSDEAGAR